MTTTNECSSCGTNLASHEIRCPTCGKTTAYYHHQRRCLHCGTPAAEKVKICMMCHQSVDSLPLSTSVFSGSWIGIGVGVLLIVGMVLWFTTTQSEANTTVAVEIVKTDTPTATLTPSATLTPTASATSSPTATSTPLPTPTPRIHTVVSGEILLHIAQFYDIDVDELAELNQLDDVRALSVGQNLILPPEDIPVATAIPPGELPPQMVYVIQEGDTISTISFDIGTPLQQILAANPNLDIDLIFPGQEIVIPLSTSTATSTPTPLPTETPLPTPDYVLPPLLSPSAGQIITESPTVLLTWASTRLLAEDEFYVVQVSWPDGTQNEQWVKNSSWHLSQALRPVAGLVTWTVVIKQQTDLSSQGVPSGELLSGAGALHSFEWH